MKRISRIHDPLLFGLALTITVLGLFFIFDAGYARALLTNKGLIPPEFRSQLMVLPFAILLAFLVGGASPEKLQKWSRPIWALSLVALVLPFVPHLGIELNGARRWVKFWPVALQPAEFAKVAAILYFAAVFADRKAWPTKISRRKNFAMWLDSIALPKAKRCFPAFWALLAIYLVDREPDLGTALVIGFTAFAMFYVGGVTRKSLVALCAISLVGGLILVKHEPYRVERIRSHFSRWRTENIDGLGYQTVQSEIAMASGDAFGAGIGTGRAKHVLPATTTDYVMATVGEEFGFVGSLGVIALLGALTLRLLVLARRVQSRFASLTLCGVAGWIGFQTCVNAMMANATLVSIGIPMPFISSGGSSLLALWLAMGLCQAVLAPVAELKEAESADRVHGWRDGRTRLSRA